MIGSYVAGTDLVLLVVEPGLQRLDHGVLGEGPRQPRQVGHLRQPGPPHLLRHGPLPPPRALAGDKDHFNYINTWALIVAHLGGVLGG